MSSAITSVDWSTALTGVDLSQILSQVIALLPIVLPVTIGFIAVRKGISFLIGSLRRA